MASNRLSPLNLYGPLTLYPKLPSRQSLCWRRMYRTACSAVHVDPPLMSSGVTSPNRIRSFSVLMMCSSCTVGVSVAKAVWMLLTRQIIPAPGFVSSRNQLSSPIPLMSAGVIVAVLSRSFRLRLSASSGTFLAGVRLCPLSRIIYTYLP